ncbi:hypothetical protein DLAC_01212 [Tieghemostelium lacteum]|uniref:Kelch motif family protein n=1 Tax=Tieghemostelium lacteum TaxID=361077 RepID=A0A152A848_TIELA|nr:hypothetical protein DLAC_01212 [Tieghemostelium lacteum]|eukprot:KYR02374.1 hypothetical protein DLAC_01212 [Tieghemostelium lacteum]
MENQPCIYLSGCNVSNQSEITEKVQSFECISTKREERYLNQNTVVKKQYVYYFYENEYFIKDLNEPDYPPVMGVIENPNQITHFSALYDGGDNIYLVGTPKRMKVKYILRFNINDKTFHKIGELPEAFNDSNLSLSGDQLYVIGGKVDRFNLTSGTCDNIIPVANNYGSGVVCGSVDFTRGLLYYFTQNFIFYSYNLETKVTVKLPQPIDDNLNGFASFGKMVYLKDHIYLILNNQTDKILKYSIISGTWVQSIVLSFPTKTERNVMYTDYITIN